MSKTVNKFIIKTCDYKANLEKIVNEKNDLYNNRIVMDFTLPLPRVTDKYDIEAYSSGCKRIDTDKFLCHCDENNNRIYIKK